MKSGELARSVAQIIYGCRITVDLLYSSVAPRYPTANKTEAVADSMKARNL